MRKLIAVLVSAVLFSAVVSGQEIRVQEVTEVTNDLEARTHPRQDLNGENCALLKIAAPSIENLVFSGNIVSDVQYKAGIYYVYVPKGTKRIDFQHNDYLPGTIDFGAFNIAIESSMVYSVILLKQEGQPTAARQFIVINVSRQDAVVELDGEMLPVSDGTAQKLVRFGTHHYRVSAPGLPAQEGDVLVNSTAERSVVNVSFTPAAGRIEVGRPDNASIVGATVFIDDSVVEGKAPMVIDDIAAGTHTVRLVKPMFSSTSVEVSVVANSSTLVNPVLTGNSAPIRVIAPDGCEMNINGQHVSSSVWESEVSAGPYIFEVVKEGKVLSSQVIDVTPSSSLKEFKLNVAGGAIAIQSSVSGAEVFLDGERVGDTPLYLPDVIPGNHSIMLSKDGYKSVSVSVDVKSEEETEVIVPMEKMVAVEQNVVETPVVMPEKQKTSTGTFEKMIELNASGTYLSTYEAFDPSFGVRIALVKKFGGYLMVGSNFGSTFNSNESTAEIPRLEAAGGMMYHASNSLYLYGGLGYALRNVSMTSPEGSKYYDVTSYGFGADLGLTLKTGKVGLSAGVFANILYVAPRVGVSLFF